MKPKVVTIEVKARPDFVNFYLEEVVTSSFFFGRRVSWQIQEYRGHELIQTHEFDVYEDALTEWRKI